MFLIYDTETTGLPRDWNAPLTDFDNWPRMVQLAWQIHDENGELVEVKNFIVKPEGYNIPFASQKIHGISTERAQKEGMPLDYVLNEFNEALGKAEFVIGHNIEFDINIAGCEYLRKEIDSPLTEMATIDTKDEATEYCAIPGGRGGKFKWPTLTELYVKLFQTGFDEAHNASADVEATTRAFLELIRIGVITGQRLGKEEAFIQNFKAKNPQPFELIGLNIEPYKPLDADEEEVETDTSKDVGVATRTVSEEDLNDFVHFHVHTQFSILEAVGQPADYVSRAKEIGMNALGITDVGNMMGAFAFVNACNKAGIKPIVGTDIYVCKDHTNHTVKDNGYQQVLIAKNKKGYHNLAKISSVSYTEGKYYVPRVSKPIIEQYHEEIMATTGGLWAEIPSLILNVGEKEAEEAFQWWHNLFGDDFYVELTRHGLEEEDVVNETLLRFAKKYNVKYFASNNVYYPTKSGADALDVLLCVKDNKLVSTPKTFLGKKGREFRFGFPNDEWYLKSPQEMLERFKDLPEAIETAAEMGRKCTGFELARDVLLPAFDIPEEFVDPNDEINGTKNGENAFLRHLTYVGAEKRYDEITDDIRERLDFELSVIEKTGYPGYFLIVQDFTTEARNMGVSVGPGRGSAAGSAVAYCIGITNVDPIKYDLLFERFLNPERVSMPDIDIDFDDEGRQRVIDYVVDKYGANQVAQIITYGSMAAKSSIRDVSRVLDLPLADSDQIAKLVPFGMSLKKIFGLSEKDLKAKLRAEDLAMAEELKKISQDNNDRAAALNKARTLEGSMRNTGIHACGVIITPSDITEHVPVAVAKDSDLWVTQFDNSVVESAGLLKMDFLGLKTLSIIKDAIEIAERRHDVKIDPDEIPLDDETTYELFQSGQTKGLFQFESPGMQKHLINLKPDKFDDLIAMNALYRPGPLEYIPNFIARKHGEEEIVYDLDDMEDLLGETYGITVYQEQVMLLSQKLAGFTKGEADSLRKAMGKKKKDIIDQLRPKFIAGCEERGHDKDKAGKVWKDWEAFAAYAFNKSHSTCYSVVAFQTAYLKANYPAAYMASVLTHNLNDITKVTEFMEECKRMGIVVLGPDVNESEQKFTVNQKGEIRFGLAAMKGIGTSAVQSLIREREENGNYTSVFDLVKRVELRSVNRKSIETLVLGGAFDSMGVRREQFFAVDPKGRTFLETVVKFGARHQENANSAQVSLFGESSEISLPEPVIPPAEEWMILEKFNREKEVVGVYISGHPLDDYKVDIDNFCNVTVDKMQNPDRSLVGPELKFGGMVTGFRHMVAKNGNPWGILTISDYTGSMDVRLFKEDYLKFKDFFHQNLYLFFQAKFNVPSWIPDGEPRLKITQMEFLNEVREKFAKHLNIRVDMAGLNTTLLDDIEVLFADHPGNTQINLQFVTQNEGKEISISAAVRQFRIDPNNTFMKELSTLPYIEYTLSKSKA
ncbi:DNA polymerase III subunit alpha [bacterium SCSIO 12643]|nr:DNA polymerase III subunit alpha [bacterium SCSIO 12643]